MDRNSLLNEIRLYADRELTKKPWRPGLDYIYPAAPVLLPEDVKMVGDALLNFWYTENKYCRRFERELSKQLGPKFVTLCNSGSSASLLAMETATKYQNSNPDEEGDQYVVTCAVGFPTTVAPIIQCGYIPLFIDMMDDFHPNYNQLQAILLDKTLSPKVIGAIFAHTLGFPYDEKLVSELLGHNRFLISDCCDAAGALLKDGLPVGYYSDMMTVSFFPSHHIMAAEGGAVLTNDEKLDKHLTSFNNWGRSCYCRPGESNTCGHRFDWPDVGDLPEGWDHKYLFDNLGYNLKMTEFQAALGYSQAQRLPEFVAIRRANYEYLHTQLYHGDVSKWLYSPEPTENFSPFGFPIIFLLGYSESKVTNELIEYLEAHKIGTRRVFGGDLTLQPGFKDKNWLVYSHLYTSHMLTFNTFWISVSPSLTKEQMDYMVYTIELFLVEKGLITP